LGKEEKMPDLSIAEKMADVIDRWRAVAIHVASHAHRQVAARPVAWWFNTKNASTREFMEALAGDPLLVVSGAPNESKLVTQFLQPSRPMGNTLASDATIIKEWITAKCPIPAAISKQRDSGDTSDFSRMPTTDEEREAFYKLNNIESFPEFRETARQLARVYLAHADYSPKYHAKFEYSEERLDERMTAIYDAYVNNVMYQVHAYDNPIFEHIDSGKKFRVGKASDKVVVDNLIQKAPFNFIDGVWLEGIMTARPSDEVVNKLFDIWADEAGNGETAQNHPNVYDSLLRSKGVYLPPISSRKFIEYPFTPSCWRTAVFQLCVGLFPHDFFPELLGMTLYLEYEATPTLMPIVRMLRGRRIDPLFYQLHAAIDNISEGHGAIALQAVKTFLNEQRQQGGEDAVQENWTRIWNGYVGWKTIGFLGAEAAMRRLTIDKKRINIGTPAAPNCIPDLTSYYKERMLALISRKAPVARKVHGGVAIGGTALSTLFDRPAELLELLIKEKLVDPKHPRDSRLFALMQFEGPMYRVFSEEEQSVIMDWIESLEGNAYECLEPLPDETGDDPAARMAEIIVDRASQAQTAHAGITLTTQGGEHRLLAELFDNPGELMGALTVSGWVSPREPERSFFLTRILQNGGPMDAVFTPDEIATVTAWIRAGAEMPHDLDRLMARRITALSPSEAATVKAGQDCARERPMIGMGSVH
jgi:hypothetical protein